MCDDGEARDYDIECIEVSAEQSKDVFRVDLVLPVRARAQVSEPLLRANRVEEE